MTTAVPPPAKQMNRPRREALSFANEAERLARRHRDRLGEETADRVLKAARAVADAAAGDDPERLSGALRLLQELFEKHFAFARKAVVREYAEAVVAAVLVTLLLRAFVVEAFRIPSTSMAPTLLAGD